MQRQLTHIFRYPVKGFSPEPLQQTLLSVDTGMPGDRRFALTHSRSQFDFTHPQWLHRRNFLVVAHCPELTALSSQYDPATDELTLRKPDQQTLRVCLADRSTPTLLNEFLSPLLGTRQAGPYRVAEVPGTSLTDSPRRAISLMNLASLQTLQQSIGEALDLRRFRGNLWIDGEPPWQELDWIDQEMTLGNVRLKIVERIKRCAAIDANPDSGVRDIKVLEGLQNYCGHRDFGVLAEVIAGGSLQIGDTC